MSKNIKFGLGGWREIIGEEFTRSNVQKIAYATLDYIDDSGVVIGYDRRFLSKNAAQWVSEVLVAYGKKVYLINKAIPTPVVMYATREKNSQVGFAITASHNPATYNGIKLFEHGGVDASKSFTDKISEAANKAKDIKILSLKIAKEKGLFYEINPTNEYVDSILDQLDKKEIIKNNYRVLLDPMYGVSKNSMLTLLYACRCEVDVINERHDALFGGQLPSPSLDTLSGMQDIVVNRGYDLGVATDGDADRVGIVDEKGNFIHPSILIALLYKYLLEDRKEKGPAVRNLTTSHLIDAIAEKHGEEVIETKVGFKHISFAMEKHNALIGGESSGGLTIRNHIKGKDGIFASLLVLEMLAHSKDTMSEAVNKLFSEYGEFHTFEKSYELKSLDKEEVNKKVLDYIDNNKESISRYSDFDGLKIYFKDDSWVVVRPSGTEPLIRIISESSSKNKAKKNVMYFEKLIKA